MYLLGKINQIVEAEVAFVQSTHRVVILLRIPTLPKVLSNKGFLTQFP